MRCSGGGRGPRSGRTWNSSRPSAPWLWLQEAELLEDVKRAVDGRRDGRRVDLAAALDQLRAGHVAVGPRQDLDERPSLRRPAQPAGAQPIADIRPGGGRGRRRQIRSRASCERIVDRRNTTQLQPVAIRSATDYHGRTGSRRPTRSEKPHRCSLPRSSCRPPRSPPTPPMHAPDGFLSTGRGARPCGRSRSSSWRSPSGETNQTLDERAVPLMGVTAAFIFAAQMFNFQVVGGTSGHLLGGVFAAVLLGPWAGTLVMACVIAVQGLVFQDGGLLVMGANIFNMGIVGTLGGYYVYRVVAAALGGEERRGSRRPGSPPGCRSSPARRACRSSSRSPAPRRWRSPSRPCSASTSSSASARRSSRWRPWPSSRSTRPDLFTLRDAGLTRDRPHRPTRRWPEEIDVHGTSSPLVGRSASGSPPSSSSSWRRSRRRTRTASSRSPASQGFLETGADALYQHHPGLHGPGRRRPGRLDDRRRPDRRRHRLRA